MDSLQLRPIYFPVGVAVNDTFLEDKETFTVFIRTEQNYELDPERDRATVTICDTTCKNIFKHICIYIYMWDYLIILLYSLLLQVNKL